MESTSFESHNQDKKQRAERLKTFNHSFKNQLGNDGGEDSLPKLFSYWKTWIVAGTGLAILGYVMTPVVSNYNKKLQSHEQLLETLDSEDSTAQSVDDLKAQIIELWQKEDYSPDQIEEMLEQTGPTQWREEIKATGDTIIINP